MGLIYIGIASSGGWTGRVLCLTRGRGRVHGSGPRGVGGSHPGAGPGLHSTPALRPRDTGQPGDVCTLPACRQVVLAGSPDSCRRREPDLYPLCEKSPRGGPIRLNGAGKREY